MRAITDSTGAIIKRIDYDSFGNILSEYCAPGTTCPELVEGFGFAGGLHDRDTGLVRFGARDYDPAIGRWTAKDPIDFAGGDLNLGTYVQNDPINYFDPWGLKVIYVKGATAPSNPSTIAMLNKLDDAVGDSDVYVTEGQRPVNANYGAVNSYHKTGMAADVYIPGFTSEQTAQKAAEVGFNGISPYDESKGGHTHVDIRDFEWNGHNGETIRDRIPRWRKPRNENCP